MEQEIPAGNSLNSGYVKQPLWHDKSPWYKLLMFIMMAFGLVSLLSFVSFLVIIPVYGINPLTDPSALSNMDDINVVGAMKILQIFNAIGLFIFPAFIAGILCSKKPWQYLQLIMPGKPVVLILTVLVMVAALPLINILSLWNSQMHLPDALAGIESWMRESEDNAAKITKAFLVMNNLGDLLVNLFVVAFLAGLGEELFFRGVIQKYFTEITKNVHVSIFLTAILFSAIHMQFFGFFPRMLLGVYFGYLLHWTGSLWVPILAHFVNNGLAVLITYLMGKGMVPENTDSIGASSQDYLLAAGSVVIFSIISFIIFKFYRSRTVEA